MIGFKLPVPAVGMAVKGPWWIWIGGAAGVAYITAALLLAPTADNLVVFHMPDRDAWEAAVQRMKDHGYAAVPSFNPFWDRQGITFEDCDGYRVVLQNADWHAVAQQS
ncbi:hypothetical protein FJV80_05110 [Mesorhizobium sp. WSM4310]|uniref:DMT family transporter n=1 Tax=Mesorhizobium sp. WSM4310 TaxID=2589883 RepID=UPI00115F66C1|nr:DMT family transporter [Mesorhizobium sp. WSM4310]TRC90517.1 hypothetical protein FJV80_05110 [Mesorhizobium sp. WSM4310]